MSTKPVTTPHGFSTARVELVLSRSVLAFERQADLARQQDTALRCAEKVLTEAVINAGKDVSDCIRGIQGDQKQVLQGIQTLVGLLNTGDPLTSEAPADALHPEHHGWGTTAAEASAQPRELVAADALDLLASMMGEGDTLIATWIS